MISEREREREREPERERERFRDWVDSSSPRLDRKFMAANVNKVAQLPSSRELLVEWSDVGFK